ncbi:MAG: hypothetical protein QW112_01585 [Candidatus Micrarchaeia archaeon]
MSELEIQQLKIMKKETELQPIPLDQLQSKLSDSKQEMEAPKESVDSLFDQVQDCLQEQFDNYLQIPMAQAMAVAEMKIKEQEKEEKKILSEEEKEEVREKIIEENLLEGEELEEVVAEEIILSSELKTIVQKIKVAMAGGTIKEISQRIMRVEEAGSETLHKGLEMMTDFEDKNERKIAKELEDIKESTRSELGKEVYAITEEGRKENIEKKELKERIKEVIEKNVKELATRRIGERIKIIADNKDMKALKDLLVKCEEDEQLMKKAFDELSKPELKCSEKEHMFREKCRELLKDRPDFLRELENLSPEDIVKRIRSYLEELQTNRYIERTRDILEIDEKNAAKELRNLMEEIAETRDGCDRLKSIIESNLEKEDLLDALKELAGNLRECRMRWRIEDLLKEQAEGSYPKPKILKQLRIILRQEYMKLLACRTFDMAARNGEFRIIDELVRTIERNIEYHKNIGNAVRRLNAKGLKMTVLMEGNGRNGCSKSALSRLLRNLASKSNGKKAM